MQDPTSPDLEEEEDTGMTEMVNISDEPIVVRISRGRRVSKVTVKPGQSHLFEAAYCQDVKGAGRQSLLPILTRQSLRADRIPRLVRIEQAAKARDYFETRTYGTKDENENEVEALEIQLASAKARREVLSKRRGKPADRNTKPASNGQQTNGGSRLSKLNKDELVEMAMANEIDPTDLTKAQLVAALEAPQE